MPTHKKQTRLRAGRSFKSVSINFEAGELPKLQERVRQQDITVSQYFRRLAKEDLKRADETTTKAA